MLLKENYYSVDWTDGDDTDFGDYIPYCWLFRDSCNEPSDSNPGHTGDLWKCPSIPQGQYRQQRDRLNPNVDVNGNILPCGSEKLRDMIKNNKYYCE